MAILFDTISHETHGRIFETMRSMLPFLQLDSNQEISFEKAVQLMQLIMVVYLHPDPVNAGNMVVQYLVEPTSPLDTKFENVDNLIKRLCEKMNIKTIFDQLKT